MIIDLSSNRNMLINTDRVAQYGEEPKSDPLQKVIKKPSN